MSDHLVGMMWNKNEGDILEQTIAAALPVVDSLFIADDGSTDNSWEIMQSMKAAHPDKIEHIQREPNKRDKAQRTSLLNKIRERYKPSRTWVQIIESDIMILETNVREALKTWASEDMSMSWQTLNAVRKPGTWAEVDTYPNWTTPVTELMPWAHWMEVMTYTFRPLPKLYYQNNPWRPWPRGWTYYTKNPLEIRRKQEDSPLLAHYGFRGPTHYYLKMKDHPANLGLRPKKYPTWEVTSPESVDRTVSFFNGEWNKKLFPMTREGWEAWVRSRRS